jgi:hypothetical protein
LQIAREKAIQQVIREIPRKYRKQRFAKWLILYSSMSLADLGTFFQTKSVLTHNNKIYTNAKVRKRLVLIPVISGIPKTEKHTPHSQPAVRKRNL